MSNAAMSAAETEFLRQLKGDVLFHGQRERRAAHAFAAKLRRIGGTSRTVRVLRRSRWAMVPFQGMTEIVEYVVRTTASGAHNG
jgi:hypothetical protein